MVGNARQGGVRPATEGSIELDFYYRGIRCRERLKLAPTPRNLRFAENLLGQVRVEIEKGTFDYAKTFPNSKRARKLGVKPGGLETVAQALRAWYAGKQSELEHSTLEGYNRIIENVLIPFCGEDKLADFGRPQAKALLASFDEKMSAKRINNILGPMRGTFADALEDGKIASDPFDGLKVRRRARVVEEDEVDPFTPDEVRAILAACTEDQFRNYCQFNLATGLRTSEMIGLQWGDIDFVGNTLRIRRAFVMGKMKAPKTSAGVRTLELVGPAVAALRAQRAHTALAGGVVFQNPRTLEAWAGDRQVRKEHWTKVLKRAGVRYRYPYQMRHTFASQALSAGENIMWVAKQMGHRDWTVTAKKYARWIPTIVPDAGRKIEQIWERQDGQKTDQKADQIATNDAHPCPIDPRGDASKG